MTTAYLVGSPMSDINAYASTSGGVAGSFGGLPDDTTDVVADVNSDDTDFDIEAKIKSLSLVAGFTKTIVQLVDVEIDEFSQAAGGYDTDGFDFVCNEVFAGTGGIFDGVGSVLLLPSLPVFNGIAFSGTPSLPTIDSSDSDDAPTTADEAILENILNPKRVRGDEGEVEMHDLSQQIEAAKFLASKEKATTTGIQSLFKKIKHSGIV